jgi:Family of unknown function (DUF6282)
MPEPASLVAGAVDLYNHANPDLLPRHNDDFGLAREAAAAGVAAVVHRHHYCSTAESTAVVRAATGFPLFGAIELSDSVGMNPYAVDLALRFGAVWVSVPTLSAAAFRPGLKARRSAYTDALLFGAGEQVVLDEHGAVLPEVADVVKLVAEAGVVLGLGYVGFDEAIAVARAAAELGHERMVTTNPWPRFTEDQVDELMAIPGVYAEVTAYMLHPEGPGAANSTAGVERGLSLLRHVGVERGVLSSDGGMVDAPGPTTILAWALETFSAGGLSYDELHTLTHVNPRTLIPAAPPEAG